MQNGWEGAKTGIRGSSQGVISVKQANMKPT